MTHARRLRVGSRLWPMTGLSFQMRSLLGWSLVCCAFLLMTAHASAQDTKTRRTVSGSSVSFWSYTGDFRGN